MVAFGRDPEAYRASNGYVVLEQGKALYFVLEVASESTRDVDLRGERDLCAGLGIGEYRRFDETGKHF